MQKANVNVNEVSKPVTTTDSVKVMYGMFPPAEGTDQMPKKIEKSPGR